MQKKAPQSRAGFLLFRQVLGTNPKIQVTLSDNLQAETVVRRCQSVFYNKVAGLRPATFVKETQAQVFSC